MKMALTIALTLLPSILLFLYIYTHDEHPEPKMLVLKVAIVGALTSVPVLISVLLVNDWFTAPSEPLARAAWSAFVEAAIPEEFFKLLAVLWVVYRHPAFDEPFDGIVYGAVASLGFATLENALYVSGGGQGVAIARALTAVPMHAFCGVIMGYSIGRARFSTNAGGMLHWGAALLWPIFYHGVYDWTIFSYNYTQNYAFLPVTLFVLIWTIAAGMQRMRRLEKENIPLLAAYHGVSEEELQTVLPKGVMSERILPQFKNFLVEASPLHFPREPYPASPLPDPASGPRRASSSVVIPARRSRGFLGALMVIFGILLSSVSAFFLYSISADSISEYPIPDEEILGSVIFGVLFFLLFLWGIRLFARGIRRNRD